MLPDRFHYALFPVYLANLQTLAYCHEQLLHVLLSQVNNLTTPKKSFTHYVFSFWYDVYGNTPDCC